MVARDRDEDHRQASWLELLFDLSFVVAVAQVAVQLEHYLAEGDVARGVTVYMMVFGAIWWAWMSFTWFANAFDTDDVPYRLLMMVMIAGSLGLAAGVPELAHLDFRIGVISYVVMRLAYVAQWGRVFRSGDPVWRPVAARMIVLTTSVQVGWVFFLLVPVDWRIPVFIPLFIIDVATPIVASWDARMGGHRGHIVERYGLFTIIVLGESIAATTIAVGSAIEARAGSLQLLVLAGGGLIVVFSLWWIYFDFTTGGAPAGGRSSQYMWGYGHYFLFAAIAAVGAGLALSVEWLTDHDHFALPEQGVAMVVGVAVATILLVLMFIESVAERGYARRDVLMKLVGALWAIGAALLAPMLTVPGSVLLIGLMLAAIVTYRVVLEHRLHVEAKVEQMFSGHT
jgi:low temperature requirement protein LtrA